MQDTARFVLLKVRKSLMKNNCNNCAHLDYYQADYEETGGSGYCCVKRVYNTGQQEGKHLRQLELDSYRQKSKKCFEARSAGFKEKL